MRKKRMGIVLLLIGTAFLFSLQTAGADDAVSVDEAADLAQDLTNPLADLMTIPIQMNYDQNIGGHQPESLLLAEEADGQRPAVGRRADRSPPDGHGFAAWWEEMGRGAGRGRADHAGTLDPGRTGQPCLVRCRRQRPAGHQQHLYPAVRGLYLAERLDPVASIRKRLQLGNGKMVGAGQCRRIQAGLFRETAGELAGRRRILAGISSIPARKDGDSGSRPISCSLTFSASNEGCDKLSLVIDRYVHLPFCGNFDFSKIRRTP
jgi:hypothetical protein